MPWIQHMLHPTRTSLWQILKKNTSINALMRCLCYTLAILTTYLLYGKAQKAELMTFIKELNEKHKAIKFDFQIAPRKVAASKKRYIENLQVNKHSYTLN